jgi:hypothetical protein
VKPVELSGTKINELETNSKNKIPEICIKA